jgi:hypothetical protein
MNGLDDLNEQLLAHGARPDWTVIGEEMALRMTTRLGSSARMLVRWDTANKRINLVQETRTVLLDRALFAFLARVTQELDMGLTLDHHAGRLVFRASIDLEPDGTLSYETFERVAYACVRQTARCLLALESSESPRRVRMAAVG